MASLPAISRFPLARRPRHGAAALDARRPAEVEGDAKLRLARRLRDEDRARRTTSVAPPRG
jgi:hypothetical protein